MDKNKLDKLHKEIAIMQKVDHPNVVKYFEVYVDKKYLYLTSEICNNGDVSKKDLPITEDKASVIIDKLLRAL
tara:strand:+ start:1940 stop:2158 length:219 start_codon:yes stop_codon:yes gene_type:complete